MIKARCTRDSGWFIRGVTYDVTLTSDLIMFNAGNHYPNVSMKRPITFKMDYLVFIIPGRVKK